MAAGASSEDPADRVRIRPPFRRWIELAMLIGVPTMLILLLLPVVQLAREQAWRSQSRNNLRQIGLALHSYDDVHSHLPPGATVDISGTPHHGWTTQLLPFLDASPVYGSLSLDRPWSDPRNAPYLRCPYPVYQTPYTDQNWTPDGWPLMHYTANPDLFYRNSSTSLQKIDETSSVWCVSEIHTEFRPWAYPFNWRKLEGREDYSLRGFGRGRFKGGYLLWLDGSVRWVDTKSNEEYFAIMKSEAAARRRKFGGPTPEQSLQPAIHFATTNVPPSNPYPVFPDRVLKHHSRP
ncbi:MAG: DUF1559 domain-containing protein [Planctomycetota bacterium]|nr:MAG: DUF1559 domain-containing protein [Planctomycetota bacterium]